MSADEKTTTRSLEKEIEIDAPLEVVWRALTEAEELKRWFPLDARVVPGVGGSIWMSWGPTCEGTAKIEVWEPNRHLGYVEPSPPHRKVAVDYFIESRGGKTVLRLVHSGFEVKEGWDDEYETVNSGWASFLKGLRHYLTHHPATPRHLVWARVDGMADREAVWNKLLNQGLHAAAPLKEGDRYRFETDNGLLFEGTVEVFRPPIHFAGSVDNLNDSFLFLEMEPGRDQYRPAIWLSTYGMSSEKAEDLQKKTDDLLESIFSPLEKAAES